MKNLELAQHFVHANATLGELIKQMPADLDGLVDNIKDSMYVNTGYSKQLSKQLSKRPTGQQQERIDQALDDLFGPRLPEGVPFRPLAGKEEEVEQRKKKVK